MYGVFLGVYVTSIIVANLIAGVKLVNLFGLVVPAGFLAYSITFPVTDVVSEIYGYGAAKEFVKVGFISNLFALLLIGVGFSMPPLSADMQELYAAAFMPMFRVMLASMVAFLVSQYLDIYVFWKLKERTRGRYLWLRNNVGEAVAQFIDTAIFILIAFYGLVSPSILANMVLSQYLWKLAVAAADTPFVYAAVLAIKALNSRVRRV